MKPNFLTIVLALSLAFAGCTIPARAQFDAMFTQYMNNEMFINPAYAGSKEAMGMTLLHRQQWVGFNGRPITTSFTINGPMYQNKMGLGLSVMNESMAILHRTLVYASYAYRIRTGAQGHLSFGLMGGVHLQSRQLGEVTTTMAGDPQFSSNIKNFLTPNFGFGIYYYSNKFYAGISIPRLIDDNLTLESGGNIVKSLRIDPSKFHYYITTGGIIRVSDGFKLKPQMMVKMVTDAPLELDLNLSGLIRDRFWLGAAYRTNADVAALAGVYLTPQFLLSYAYDYPITKIRKYSGGSHEIALSYLFRYKESQIVSPRHF